VQRSYCYFSLSLLPFGIKTVSLVPVTIVENAQNRNAFSAIEKGPHSELEGAHFNL
jgi:hypothetical protein